MIVNSGADGSALPYVYEFAAIFMLRHEDGVDMRKWRDAFPSENLVVARRNTEKSKPAGRVAVGQDIERTVLSPSCLRGILPPGAVTVPFTSTEGGMARMAWLMRLGLELMDSLPCSRRSKPCSDNVVRQDRDEGCDESESRRKKTDCWKPAKHEYQQASHYSDTYTPHDSRDAM
jgi:hypothetical protein